MIFVVKLMLAALLASGALAAYQRNGSGCLTHFHKNRTHFAPCKKTLCFLFQDEKPVSVPLVYVSAATCTSPHQNLSSLNFKSCEHVLCEYAEKFIDLDPEMQTTLDQKLFPCRSRRKAFPRLDGIAFKIHQEMTLDTEPLCVWAGKNCSFNNMVDFVHVTAKSRKTRKYQFAISGFLTILPRRVSLYTFPTTPFLNSEVIVLGPNGAPKGPIQSAFQQVFRAFQLPTWLLLASVVVLFILLTIIISTVFSTPSTALNILANLFGYHSQDRRFSNEGMSETRGLAGDVLKLRVLHRATMILLGIAFSAFTIIAILFYEVSVVNFIFTQNRYEVGKEVSTLTNSDLSLYTVVKGTAEETVWRRSVDPSGKRFPNETLYPWYRCSGSDDCYEKVLDRKDPRKYMVTFDAEVSYQLLKRQACSRLTIYKTSRPLFSFGGGWYMGKAVDSKLRVKIDQELLRLKQEDKMREILESKVKNLEESCGPKNQDIGPGVIAIPLFFIVGPCIVALLVLLCCGCFVRCRINRKGKT